MESKQDAQTFVVTKCTNYQSACVLLKKTCANPYGCWVRIKYKEGGFGGVYAVPENPDECYKFNQQS